MSWAWSDTSCLATTRSRPFVYPYCSTAYLPCISVPCVRPKNLAARDLCICMQGTQRGFIILAAIPVNVFLLTHLHKPMSVSPHQHRLPRYWCSPSWSLCYSTCTQSTSPNAWSAGNASNPKLLWSNITPRSMVGRCRPCHRRFNTENDRAEHNRRAVSHEKIVFQ